MNVKSLQGKQTGQQLYEAISLKRLGHKYWSYMRDHDINGKTLLNVLLRGINILVFQVSEALNTEAQVPTTAIRWTQKVV